MYMRALVFKEVEPCAPHPRIFVLSLEKPRADDLCGSSFTGLAKFGAWREPGSPLSQGVAQTGRAP